MLNASGRLIFRIPKFDHISPTLFHLYWLPVAYRVHFKLLLLVYKSLTNQGPQYIQEYLQPYSITGHHLRSCNQGLLKIPRTNFLSPSLRHICSDHVVSGQRSWKKIIVSFLALLTFCKFCFIFSTFCYFFPAITAILSYVCMC